MFKLSVPLNSKIMNAKNRDKYLNLVREAGVDRVFICGVGEPAATAPAHVFENVKFFKDAGYEVGIWLGSLGHGFVLVAAEAEEEEFTQIVTIDGDKMHHANCPLDEGFRRHFAHFVGELAKAGPDLIMLDDDFRMSQREEDFSCACPRHIKRISEILGESITREKLRPYVISGKANKYRDAWLKAQEEALLLLAHDVRKEIDKVSEDIGFCTCMSVSGWNVGGVDVLSLARTMAGKNAPVLRLTGAPYWAGRNNFTLVAAIEQARLLASFCKGSGIDLMCEGDVYPRPRYTCPASYLEVYDAAMRADGGYDGILKYMFDYIAGPDFETGYLKLHADGKALREKVSEWFEGGEGVGVRIISRPHTMKDADLDLSSLYAWSPTPFDAAMIASSGIPTIYHGKGICNSVFGENARALELSELKCGTVLDAVSAVILTERGVDVGLKSYGELSKKEISLLCTNDPEYKSYIENGKVRFLSAELKDNAVSELYLGAPSKENTVAYTYENASGERFLVFLFEADSMRSWAPTCNSGILKNYATADVFTKKLPWVARRAIPAFIEGNPETSLICKKNGDSMAIAVFNCFADPLTKPVITLDEEYSSIECFGTSAKIEGNKITLTEKLHGFSAAVLRVKK